MPVLLLRLHLHVSNSCLCVCQRACALLSFSTFIYNYHHIHMHACDDYCAMTTYNMNIPITTRLCAPADEASLDVYTLMIPCSRVSISIFIRVYASYECTHTMCIEKMFTPVCTSPFHMCVPQHRLYPYLFHPPEHVLMCACLHQDGSIQIERIHVNN